VQSIQDCLIVFDDIGYFVSAVSYPEEFEYLIRFSRHKNQDLIIVSHRLSDIPKLIIQNVDYIYFFKMTYLKDIELAKMYIPNKNLQSFEVGDYAIFEA
jgi:hypothetical protein